MTRFTHRRVGWSIRSLFVVVLAIVLVEPLGMAVTASADSVAGAATATPAVSGLPAGFSTKTVLNGLHAGPGGNPTAFAYAPDGRIFVARKAGVLDVWYQGKQYMWADLRDRGEQLPVARLHRHGDRSRLLVEPSRVPALHRGAGALEPRLARSRGRQAHQPGEQVERSERVGSVEPHHPHVGVPLDRDAALGREPALRERRFPLRRAR